MKLAFVFCICAAILLGGCDRPKPEEVVEAFNNKWAPEVVYQDGHLLVNWPDNKDFNPPWGALSMKIPPTYLNKKLGGLDDNEKINQIFFEINFLNGEPLSRIRSNSWPPTEEEQALIKDRMAKRVFVVLFRDRYMQEMKSMHREKFSVGGAGKYAFRDGEVDGLEKWSAAVCMADHLTSPPDYKAMVQQNLDAKAADDRSPAGCYKDVRKFVLITPETDTHNDLVTANCWNETCWFNFNVANRTAELTIDMSAADRWRERVEVARRVISGFVISSNP